MSDIEIQINELLDTTIMMCDEVAAQVGCPVEWVEKIVDSVKTSEQKSSAFKLISNWFYQTRRNHPQQDLIFISTWMYHIATKHFKNKKKKTMVLFLGENSALRFLRLNKIHMKERRQRVTFTPPPKQRSDFLDNQKLQMCR